MDRVAEIRRRLDEKTELALRVLESAPPCSACRYSKRGLCSNPAFTDYVSAPHAGLYGERVVTPIEEARSTLCGADGLLFDPLTHEQQAIRAARSAGAWVREGGILVLALIVGFALAVSFLGY